MMIDVSGLEQLLTGALFFASNFALVVGLTAVGAAINEQSGVLNLGHEGVMLLGAATGFVVTFWTESGWLGLLAGAIAGAGLGALKVAWSIVIKTEQVINGLLLVPIGIGLANMLYKHQFLHASSPPRIAPMPTIPVPFLHEMPIIGPVVFNRSAAFYGAILLIALAAHFLGHTRTGMIIRAAGESPEALDFNGIAVDRYRVVALLIGTAFTGLAGALLTIDQVHIYSARMTAGRGWIAIAIVIVGGWRPWTCLLAALLFGFIDMLQFQVQVQSAAVPYEILLSLPYLATIAVLALRQGTVRPPAALGIPYVR
ncbi:MAG: ABC transporter permease [Armatimonadota bacterium]|nr:ABC transporter permease [Armatimonadota bacterium]MDR7548634.1 ABC transporter permease [Armatimonadota bacterium]